MYQGGISYLQTFWGYWGTASWLWVKVLPSLGDCFVVVDNSSYLKVPSQVPKISVGWNQFIFT